jgi:hypothetical protein
MVIYPHRFTSHTLTLSHPSLSHTLSCSLTLTLAFSLVKIDAGDFNSSDVEFKSAPLNPFAHAGKARIGQIVDYAFEDRLASKKASKLLTNSKVS